MGSEGKQWADLGQMSVEYGKFRDRVRHGPNRGQVTFRAVPNIVENVHLEGTVSGSRFECDEPEERGALAKRSRPSDGKLT